MKRSLSALLAALLVAGCAIAQVPDDAAAHANELRRSAFAAELGKDHQAAAEAFLELRTLEPDNPEWVIRAAENLGMTGRFNDAMDLLQSAQTKFPDVLAIPATLAKTFHLKADAMRAEGVFDTNVAFYYQDTIRTAERVLELDPDQFESRLLLASARYELGESDAALEQAEEAVRRHPGAFGAHALVGRIAYDRFVRAVQDGDDEARERYRARATEAFRKALASDGTRALPMVRLGDIAAWSNELEVALERYAEAMVIDPRANIDHDWLRGRLDADKRTAFYLDVLERYRARPETSPAAEGTIVWFLAQARFDAKDYEQAAERFAAALEAIPDYDPTYFWLFRARYWAGQEKAAQETAVRFSRTAPRAFADMIRTDEQSMALVVSMASRAFQSGSLADSRDLNLVVAYASQTADAWNNYAFLCRETGEFAESLRGYEEALDIEPDSPQLLNDAGVILQYHLTSPDNLARARTLYDRAIEIAQERLASGGLEGDELERTKVALRDAKANLIKMR